MTSSKQLDFDTEEHLYPLDEKIFLHSGIAIFESQISKLNKDSPDYDFLSSIPEKYNVFSGAADTYLYPFICFPTSPLKELPVGRKVLKLLMASSFESEHIKNLDVVKIPYPGYHPNTKNDEIHSDPNEQGFLMHDIESLTDEQIFNYVEMDLGWDPIENLDDLNSLKDLHKYHKTLRGFVINKHLYYVLIHTKPKDYGDFELSEYVILFAVGVSPKTGNLIGVVGHQVCHNFCD